MWMSHLQAYSESSTETHSPSFFQNCFSSVIVFSLILLTHPWWNLLARSIAGRDFRTSCWNHGDQFYGHLSSESILEICQKVRQFASKNQCALVLHRVISPSSILRPQYSIGIWTQTRKHHECRWVILAQFVLRKVSWSWFDMDLSRQKKDSRCTML
jgi:hypothetical protein